MTELSSIAAEAPEQIVAHWKTTKGVKCYQIDEKEADLLKMDQAAFVAKYKPRGLVALEFWRDKAVKADGFVRRIANLDVLKGIVVVGTAEE